MKAMVSIAPETYRESMPSVIIFRRDLLPRSETFIRAQALGLTRWHPILAGEHLVPDGLPLEGIDRMMVRDRGNRWRDFWFNVWRRLKLPDPSIARILRASGAQLVHVHFGVDAVSIWPSVHLAGLPMLVTLHGYDINIHSDWWKAGNGGLQHRDYPDRLLRMSRQPKVHFIAVSTAIRERAIEYGIPANKVTVHYTGVDTDSFSPVVQALGDCGKRILFIGRLVEKKGVEYLLRAFAEIRLSIPDAELLIAGDGPMRPALQALAASLEVPAEFLGSVPSTEVEQLLHRVRALCLPSVTAANGDAEGFGMVLLEAQASGVPVVTSARGGATEGLINGKTGFRFKERDVQALAHHLADMLTDDLLLSRLSRNAAEFVAENFELKHHSHLLEELYSLHGKS